MRITKIGHCCLVIEENGARIMTDPGNMSSGQEEVEGLNAILITHEHPDHIHMDSLKQILEKNSGVRVITNKAVSVLLQEEGIAYELLENGQRTEIGKVVLEAFDAPHATIHDSIPAIQNTGFFVGNILFYPGDAFINPGREVPLLALPVVGPWMKTAEAIEYARSINPKLCFPVHDGMLKSGGPFHRVPSMVLEKMGIPFQSLEAGGVIEFNLDRQSVAQ